MKQPNNLMGKAQPKVQQISQPDNSRQSSRRRRRANRRRRRRINRGVGAYTSLLVNRTLRMRELWSTITVAANSTGHVEKLNFTDGTFPVWFGKAAKLYEMFQLHYIRIYFNSTAATTTSGTVILSYNTNSNQAADVRTLSQLAAQQNARQGSVHDNMSVVIPAGALKNFRTNTPTSGNDSWSFNVELGVDQNTAALSIPVWIEYVVTFRNPQV